MEAVYTLIGVVVGAVVVLLTPMIIERRKERLRLIHLLNALLTELEYNEYAARTAKEKNLTLGYLGRVLDKSCYQQAIEGGALANLPHDVLENLLQAYDKPLRLAMLLSQESPPSDEQIVNFLGDFFNEVPRRFKVAADGLRQYLSASK